MRHILFIQGAGDGAYDEDKILAESLKQALGAGYQLHYPPMPDASYDEWKQAIEKICTTLEEPIILVGHSVGASIIIKYVSEAEVKKSIEGIFLLAAPFLGGDGWRYDGYETLALSKGFATKLPQGASIFLYHCYDDEIVPFGHLSLYAQVLSQATVREIPEGGHQLNHDLSMVAEDIKTL